MKYIISLSVLLVGHILSSIADDSNIITTICEHGLCDSINTSLEKEWSVKNISQAECENIENTFYQHKTMLKITKRTWGNVTRAIKKKQKYFVMKSVKKIKTLNTKHRGKLSSLMKMSRVEFEKLLTKTKEAEQLTTNALIETWELFNLSLNLLRTSLEQSANSTELLANIYIHKMKNLSELFNTRVYCLVRSGKIQQAKSASMVVDSEILKLFNDISKTLTNMYRFQAKNINNMASKFGDEIINNAENIIKQLKPKEKTNNVLLRYIDFATTRIKSLSQLSKDKSIQLTKKYLDMLEREVDRIVKTMIDITTLEGALDKAIANSHNADIEKLENEINNIYKTIKHTNKEYNAIYLNAVNGQIADMTKKSKKALSVKFRPTG